MSITSERIVILTKFLDSNEERARSLLSLEPNIAVEKINAQGFNFTELELRAYGEFLNSKIELLEDDVLASVAGGVSGNMDDFMSKDSLHFLALNNVVQFGVVYGIPGGIRW